MTQEAQTKQDTTQLLVPKSRWEMLFQAAHCNSTIGRASGSGCNVEPLNDPIFLSGHSRECMPVVCGLSRMPVGKSPGLPKSVIAPSSANAGTLRDNWYGPHRAIRTVGTGASVLCNYATRYPEAVALRNISAKSVAEALFRMISRVGIPKEILTDQGTALMSRTIRKLYELLGIKPVRTSVYHPQTDPKLIRRQLLRPARDPRPKRR